MDFALVSKIHNIETIASGNGVGVEDDCESYTAGLNGES
jgi:hypothetical protein